MKTVQELITDKQIDFAWGNANFGSRTKRDMVRFAVLKKIRGYHNGHTIQCIIDELGLTKNGHATEFGMNYLFVAFPNGYPDKLTGY